MQNSNSQDQQDQEDNINYYDDDNKDHPNIWSEESYQKYRDEQRKKDMERFYKKRDSNKEYVKYIKKYHPERYKNNEY